MILRDYEWSVSNELKASYWYYIDQNKDAFFLESDIPHPYRAFIIEKCYQLKIPEDEVPNIVLCQALYDLDKGWDQFQKSCTFIERMIFKKVIYKRINRIKNVYFERNKKREMYPSLLNNKKVQAAMEGDLSEYRHYAEYHMNPSRALVEIEAENLRKEYYRRTHG